MFLPPAFLDIDGQTSDLKASNVALETRANQNGESYAGVRIFDQIVPFGGSFERRRAEWVGDRGGAG